MGKQHLRDHVWCVSRCDHQSAFLESVQEWMSSLKLSRYVKLDNNDLLRIRQQWWLSNTVSFNGVFHRRHLGMKNKRFGISFVIVTRIISILMTYTDCRHKMNWFLRQRCVHITYTREINPHASLSYTSTWLDLRKMVYLRDMLAPTRLEIGHRKSWGNLTCLLQRRQPWTSLPHEYRVLLVSNVDMLTLGYHD